MRPHPRDFSAGGGRRCAGVWGGKGQGKTFQVELIFKALGVEPIILSAGELESEKAGEPGRLIRDRYREAHMVIKNKVLGGPTMIGPRPGPPHPASLSAPALGTHVLALWCARAFQGPTKALVPCLRSS